MPMFSSLVSKSDMPAMAPLPLQLPLVVAVDAPAMYAAGDIMGDESVAATVAPTAMLAMVCE